MLNRINLNIYTTICPYSNIRQAQYNDPYNEFEQEPDDEEGEDECCDYDLADVCVDLFLRSIGNCFECDLYLDSLESESYTQECKHSGRLGDREERREKDAI